MPLMEKGFDRGKNRISLFFIQSPDFFHGSPDFPLPGIGRSAVKPFLAHLYLKQSTVCSVIVSFKMKARKVSAAFKKRAPGLFQDGLRV